MVKVRHPSLEQTDSNKLPRFNTTSARNALSPIIPTFPLSNETSPENRTPFFKSNRQRRLSFDPYEDSTTYPVSNRFSNTVFNERRLPVVYSINENITEVNSNTIDEKRELISNKNSRIAKEPMSDLTPSEYKRHHKRKRAFSETRKRSEKNTFITDNQPLQELNKPEKRNNKHKTNNLADDSDLRNINKSINPRKQITHGSLLLKSDNEYSSNSQDLTPLRSIVPVYIPSQNDSKAGRIGRFVVLKAAVSNQIEAISNSELKSNTIEVDPPKWSFTLDDNSSVQTADSIGLPGSTYWTVTSAKSGQGICPVILTPPGAQNIRKNDESQIINAKVSSAPSHSNTSSTAQSEQSSRRVSHSVHNRFRQFIVESFRGSRMRANSEQQTPNNLQNINFSIPFDEKVEETGHISGLKPHAHTITAGTNQYAVKKMFQPLNIQSDENKYDGLHDASSTLPSDPKRHLKTTRKMVRRFLSLSNTSSNKSSSKSINEGYLPDPSKLPREEPQSSLEFTQSRLKNLPRKTISDNASKNKEPANTSSHILPRGYLLEQNSEKSDELLMRAFSRPTAGTRGHGSRGHHHHHHHHHHRHGHGHYKRGHHQTSHRHQPTLTRVTENRRYLMFTTALPFRSPNDYLQTRGKGLSDSETYSVLFQHTLCYELMPESAKLVTIDSRLPVGKAFRALCVNGIRAAPVWDSTKQTFTGLLTINDFLQMLNHCWRCKNSNESVNLCIDDLESFPVSKWKEISASEKKISSTFMNLKGSQDLKDEVSKSSSFDQLEHAISARSMQFRSPSENSDDGSLTNDSESIVSAPSKVNTQNSYSNQFELMTIIQPEDTLYMASKLLSKKKLHRLPVFENAYHGNGNPLFVLTHRCLLAFLYRKQVDLPRPRYLQSGLKEARVGTYENLSLVTHATKLVDALVFFEGERVSSLPVVNCLSERRLVDIFAKFDVITLILAGRHKKPDLTVKDVLDICKQIHLGVIPSMPVPPDGPSKFAVETCLTTDTIQFALNKLMRTGYHRLIVVNNNTDCCVEGVVSISDLLYYMVLRKPITLGLAASTNNETYEATTATTAEAPDWLFFSEKDLPVVDQSTLNSTMLSISPYQSAGSAKLKNEDAVKRLPEVETLTQLTEENVARGAELKSKKQRAHHLSVSSSSSSSRSSRSCSVSSSDYSSGSTTESSMSEPPSFINAPVIRERQVNKN